MDNRDPTAAILLGCIAAMAAGVMVGPLAAVFAFVCVMIIYAAVTQA